MKKLLFFLSFMMIGWMGFSQEDAKLTVKVSSDSVLLGNYVEVKFIIENTSVNNFEPPKFAGFTIVSGPNQSSSMMINNGVVTQSIAYSYYVEPIEVGNYFIEPAFAETEDGILKSIPVEILVVDNPDGIIQNPRQQQQNNLFQFDSKDFFGGDNFFGGNDFFNDFFDRNKNPLLQDERMDKKIKPKKKRKVYKL